MSSLSPNEIEALMGAIDQGRLDTTAEKPTTGTVVAYDLTSQDRVIRAQLPTLDSINDLVASSLSMGWGGRLRMMVSVSAEPAQLRKFADFHALLRPPSTFAMLQLSNQHGPAVLVVPEELVRVMLGAALGDRAVKLRDNNFSASATRRDLTNVERSVLGKLVGVMCEALGQAWSMVLPLQPRVQRFETDPRLAIVAPPGDVVIINAFNVSLNDAEAHAQVHLGIPFTAVETVKKRLAASPRNSSVSDGSSARHVAERIADVPVETRVLLGGTRMALKDLLNLKVGDLIHLDTSEANNLLLLVQGVPRAAGTPTVVGGRMALELTHGLFGTSASAAGHSLATTQPRQKD